MSYDGVEGLQRYDGRIAAIGRPPDDRGWISVHVGKLRLDSDPIERQYLQLEVILTNETAPNGLEGFDTHDTEQLGEDLADFENDIVRAGDEIYPVTWLPPDEADRVRRMLATRTARRTLRDRLLHRRR